MVKWLSRKLPLFIIHVLLLCMCVIVPMTVAMDVCTCVRQVRQSSASLLSYLQAASGR